MKFRWYLFSTSLLLVAMFVLFGFSIVHSQESIGQISADLNLYDVEWHPSEDILAVAGEWGLKLLDIELNEIANLDEELSEAISISWKADGSQLAVAEGIGDHRSTTIWNWNADELLFQEAARLERNYSGEIVTAWSPNGLWLATLSIDTSQQTADSAGIVQIWDTSTWELAITIPFTVFAPIHKIDWSIDSSIIVFGGDYGLHVFDLQTQETVFDIANSTGFNSFALSENELAIATPSEIMLLDISTWELRASFDYSAGRVLWHHEDEQLILAHSDDEILVVEATTGQLLSEASATYSRVDGEIAVYDFDVSSNDHFLATCSSDGIIEIWSFEEG